MVAQGGACRGASQSSASDFLSQRITHWLGYVCGLAAPLTLRHIELHHLTLPHAALEFAGVILGDGRLVKESIFLWIVPIFNHLMDTYTLLVMNF